MRQLSISSFVQGAAAIAVVIGVGIASPAFAVSGGGNSGSGASTPACAKGTVWSPQKKACVASTSGLLNDQELYTQGRDLALAGRYEEALTALKAVNNQDDSMVLTMIGYSTRKLGNYDEGLAYYNRALALNPSNANTREYLGEAYAEKGQVDLAKAELVKVEAICGTSCEQYQDLAAAIRGELDGD